MAEQQRQAVHPSADRAVPVECITCQRKPCQETEAGTLDICDYGIAFYNNGAAILKKRERVTMRHVAANLRHELHKVLQYILMQAEELDPSVSLRRLEVTRPASRIAGATLILDHFIQMISGVYDFSPDKAQSLGHSRAPISLHESASRYLAIYSLIKNTRRASDLEIRLSISETKRVSFLPAVIDYLIAVLCDNLFKYSVGPAPAKIRTESFGDNLVDLVFINLGEEVPLDGSIFEKGYQRNSGSEGFGFGLYWARLLIEHYNEVSGRTSDRLELTHHQESIPDDEDLRPFIIRAPSNPRGRTQVQHTFRLRHILVE